MTASSTLSLGGGSVTITVFPSQEDWAGGAAMAILSRLETRLASHRNVSLALSGGSTPAPVFRAMARELAQWPDEKKRKIHWFFVDERCVSP